VWQDSFLTFGVLTDFSEPAPYPQLEETIQMQRKLQEMGCTEIHIEGCGPFGLSSGGCGYGRSEFFDRVQGKEYGLYHYVADTTIEPESYFRALASKGVIGITTIQDFQQLPSEVRDQVVRLNHIYFAVLPRMKRRRLIGEGDRWLGVEWFDQRGNQSVLFAFDRMDWKVSGGDQVRDLTAGRECAVVKGRVQTVRWHVYAVL